VKTRPDLAALAFCALVVTGVVVLAALHVDVPDFLPAVGMFVAGVGGGAALNASPAAAATARPAPLLDVPAPRPAPLTTEPATGVFARIATHEP
jgi:hypothetical protein